MQYKTKQTFDSFTVSLKMSEIIKCTSLSLMRLSKRKKKQQQYSPEP